MLILILFSLQHPGAPVLYLWQIPRALKHHINVKVLPRQLRGIDWIASKYAYRQLANLRLLSPLHAETYHAQNHALINANSIGLKSLIATKSILSCKLRKAREQYYGQYDQNH